MNQDDISFGFSTPVTPAGKCPSCGGSDLVRGLELSQTVEVGSVGLRYKAGRILVGTEPLRAELCRRCGTIVRLYVKETNRNWLQKD
jgi:hypothetical protein